MISRGQFAGLAERLSRFSGTGFSLSLFRPKAIMPRSASPDSNLPEETSARKTIGPPDPVEVDSKFHAADPMIPRNVPLGFGAKIRAREDTWRSLSQAAQATSAA
jgi:hypothetical protein